MLYGIYVCDGKRGMNLFTHPQPSMLTESCVFGFIYDPRLSIQQIPSPRSGSHWILDHLVPPAPTTSQTSSCQIGGKLKCPEHVSRSAPDNLSFSDPNPVPSPSPRHVDGYRGYVDGVGERHEETSVSDQRLIF